MSAFGTVRPREFQRIKNLLPVEYQGIEIAKFNYEPSPSEWGIIDLIVQLQDNTVLRRKYKTDLNGNERPITEWVIT